MTKTDVKRRKKCWLPRRSTLTISLQRRHVSKSWIGRSHSPSTTSHGTRSNSASFLQRNVTRCTRVRFVMRKHSTRKSSVGKTSIKSSSQNSSMSLNAFSSELPHYQIKLKLLRMHCLWKLIKMWSTGLSSAMKVKLKISASARASTSLRLGALSCVRVRMTASMGVGSIPSVLQTSFGCPRSKSTNLTSGTARIVSNAVANKTKTKSPQSPSHLRPPKWKRIILLRTRK